MAIGLTQSLTEMGTRTLSGYRERLQRKAGTLLTICEPVV
jgi:hypothetical protein